MKSIVSAGALAIAMGLAAPAMAQTPTMIGNQQLTEADATRVQNYCNDLQTQSNQTPAADSASDDAATTEGEATTDDGGQAALGGVDLDMVTIENCADAGFIEGPVTPTN